MKKILTLLVLLFAFSINAQESKALTKTRNAETDRAAHAPEEMAKKEFVEFSNYIELSNEQQRQVYELFQMKQKMLFNQKVDEEFALKLKNEIGEKLLSVLDKKQIEKLKSDETLFKKFVY